MSIQRVLIAATTTCVFGCSAKLGSSNVETDAAGSAGDSGVDAADEASPDAPVEAELCPSLPIPPTCNGRNVVYREFGPNAVGDGSYFASEAPWRLGFNRHQGVTWIVKFQTEADTYLGKVSAYGDNTGGLAWISDKPCDPTFAVTNHLVVYGNHGGGTNLFVVARNDADAATLHTNPAYTSYKNVPQLRGGGCYYAVFQNTAQAPTGAPDVSYINTVAEACGNESGCYYLAFDMGPRLHTFTNQTIAGNVISGLTVGP
jgi:hypothetical protein